MSVVTPGSCKSALDPLKLELQGPDDRDAWNQTLVFCGSSIYS